MLGAICAISDISCKGGGYSIYGTYRLKGTSTCLLEHKVLTAGGGVLKCENVRMSQLYSVPYWGGDWKVYL